MNTNLAEIVPEVLEEQFNRFKGETVVESKELIKLMDNPLIML
jgi:hypothetical protein